MKKAFHTSTTSLFFLSMILLFQTSFLLAQRGPQKLELNHYIGDTKKIAIAEFMGFSDPKHALTSPYLFKIEQPLKGGFDKTDIFLNHKPGYIDYLNKGDKCVIFITDGNIWMENQLEHLDMVGRYQEGKNGNDKIIYMQDFYDSTGIQSHWDMEAQYSSMQRIVPQSFTEKQLKDFLNSGKYSLHASGYLHFFSEKTQLLEPSKLGIRIDCMYGKENLIYTVTTDFNTNDFPAKPALDVFAMGYIGKMIYNENGTRPLEISYEFIRADSSGENIEAKFWIESPEEINEKEFVEYLANPSYGPPYFEFELVMSNKTTYKLMRWDELRAFDMELVGFMNQTFTDTRMSPPNPKGGELEMKYGEDELIIQFKPRAEKLEKWPYIQDALVREAKIAPIEATLTWKKNGMTKNFGTCTIYYKKTGFAFNPNYLKK
jgi:hypothetical protein